MTDARRCVDTTRNNLYPDEKGTERYPDSGYCVKCASPSNNLYPDEKGTESIDERMQTLDGQSHKSK